MTTRPVEVRVFECDERIKSASPLFCEIHEQAQKAEQLGLDQIAGVGYRKALEFLIKDYAISKSAPDEEASIKERPLGKVIENFTQDRIKNVAKRATWLGNDETHYVRKWETKDISDLKLLINLVVHWIEMELMTQEALDSMPDG